MLKSPACIVLLLFSFSVFALAPGAWAADGKIEINQASVDAAGGFPYAIVAPGNYVLTSDLVVPTNKTAILIRASSGVRLDLNGFHIQGPPPCSIAGCTSGAASGVTTDGFAGGITVVDGEISGFSGSCVDLDTSARVENLIVSQCGLNGIVAGEGSVVAHNRLHTIARTGLALGKGAVYTNNSLLLTGLSGSFPAVTGGLGTNGNYCADRSCASHGERRFYLTNSTFAGQDAANRCQAGFHVAQMGELLNPSALHYDATLGRSDYFGQVAWAFTTPNQDCGDFTSATGSGNAPFLSASSGSVQWAFSNVFCQSTFIPVWCVED